jgi:hypothetical protein
MTKPFMTPADQQELGTVEDEAKLHALLAHLPDKLNYDISNWPDPYECPTDQYERWLLLINEDLYFLNTFFKEHPNLTAEEDQFGEHQLVESRRSRLLHVRDRLWVLRKLRDEALAKKAL